MEDPYKPRHLYRDPDNRTLAGVCSGISIYFNLDPVIGKLLFLVLLFGAGAGLLLYIILWIVLPLARTPAQKCELRGIPPTEENCSRFFSSGRSRSEERKERKWERRERKKWERESR